ncbi:DUF4159 domain-containing protein [Luteibaculum oceani]|uniref:DUF4159 domain-containing protein n=1 Tax=Luteibaculum oceani TaxID=1294296 RepID=A0A5C6V9M8_9FLAO|nr:DUF4159 domain-containing protein [Luteibaculum oceani]TXC81470.1 DUF4159 domain-containing protein [Luteibaculum oceani]
MKFLTAVFILTCSILFGQYDYEIAQLKYSGGGDYYANPSSLKNLVEFANNTAGTSINPNYNFVETGSQDLFRYPYIYVTGHGNVLFNPSEVENLKNYLLAGGFLHIDDNYGMDAFIRTEIKKLFPDKDWVELPFNHPIYHQKFDFANGLPKIHAHDGQPSEGLAIMEGERVLIFYSFQSDLGDGWEDAEVHNNPEETRLKALRMGTNVLLYALFGSNQDIETN